MSPDNPDESLLLANAWCGDAAATGAQSDDASAWALRRGIQRPLNFLGPAAAPKVELRDWRHEKVGWGVVLPDRDGLLNGERDTGADAPAAIRRLIAARGDAPVFRYRPDIAPELQFSNTTPGWRPRSRSNQSRWARLCPSRPAPTLKASRSVPGPGVTL